MLYTALEKKKQEKKPIKELEELGKKLVSDIDKGRNPTIEFSLRSLSNVVFDARTKTLGLGEKQQQRTFKSALRCVPHRALADVVRCLPRLSGGRRCPKNGEPSMN